MSFQTINNKLQLLLLLSPLFTSVHAQTYTLPDGAYMDTISSTDTTCRLTNIYYYSVNGKYPESSITLLNKVQKFLLQKDNAYTGSGYVTFRFRVDCTGHRIPRTQVLQTDENYSSADFNKEFVSELFLFVKSLNNWPIVKNGKGNPYSYHAFISFKIKNGKVVNVIP